MGKEMKEVIITVTGGVAEVHTHPKGVNVKIVDFDCDGTQGENPPEEFEGSDAIIEDYEGARETEVNMIYFLLIGMYSGLVAETKAFRKEDDAKQAFLDYTGFNWEAVTSDDQVMEMLDATKFTGSCVQELQIEA